MSKLPADEAVFKLLTGQNLNDSEKSEVLAKLGNGVVQAIDSHPLNDDLPGAILSGDLAISGTPYDLPQSLIANFLDPDYEFYTNSDQTWELYWFGVEGQLGEWNIYHYPTSIFLYGDGFQGAGLNDVVWEGIEGAVTGSIQGNYLPAAVPKSVGKWAIYEESLYFNAGTDLAPNWQQVANLSEVVSLTGNQTISGPKIFTNHIGLPATIPGLNQAVPRSYLDGTFRQIPPNIVASATRGGSNINMFPGRAGSWWADTATGSVDDVIIRLDSSTWQNWAHRLSPTQLGATLGAYVVISVGSTTSSISMRKWSILGRNNGPIASLVESVDSGSLPIDEITIGFDHVTNGKMDIIITIKPSSSFRSTFSVITGFL